MRKELLRLGTMLQLNHSWLFIGIEELVAGIYFIACPGAITGNAPGPVSIGFLDDWLPATVWIALGVWLIINNIFVVVPDRNRILGFVSLGMWGFYAALFIMRDLNDPTPPAIGMTSVFFLIIMARILTLLLLDDSHSHKITN